MTAPQRKRSKLTEETFVPRPSEEVNGSTEMNGDVHVGTHLKPSMTPAANTELPMRSAKKDTLKRAMKGDGATLLAQNDIYAVKLLPSTPKELKKEGVRYRGALGARNLALAVTREHAYIWEYTAHTPVNNPTVLDVPFATGEDEPLPYGALVPTGTSIDTGLVLVSASSGKIVYFESIERVISLSLFQERKKGVEGGLGNLFSGETVVELSFADHAGFIVTLSSGRIAQLTLRDAQGKARIFTQFLSPIQSSSGGIFGSIRGLIGGSWKRGVVAVHTRAMNVRGQMQVVSLSERAEVQLWEVNWSGSNQFKHTFDLKQALVQELKTMEPPETHGRVDQLTAVDFAILGNPTQSRGDELATAGAEQPLDIWLLLRIGATYNSSYVLAQVSLHGEEANLTRTLPLESCNSALPIEIGSRPRLLLPSPGHTAVVVFGDAVLLASTTESEPDPDAQLHAASYVDLGSFEDAIYLRTGRDLGILGAVTEDGRSGQASLVAFIKGAGLVRIVSADATSAGKRSRLPIKTKIEQAVFYGALVDNILDFSRKDKIPYEAAEVEEAAISISQEVLRSESSFISKHPTSIQAQLKFKAQALDALATHVVRNYPAVSRSAMWQLLSDAEIVTAALQMWSIFEEYSNMNVASGKRRASIFDEICPAVIGELRLNLEDDAQGDEDIVRLFFIRALPHVNSLLVKIRHVLEIFRHPAPGQEMPQKILRVVQESTDIWVKTMEAVFAFRADNAAAYGILMSPLDQGVLANPGDYADLAEFWTSSLPMLKAAVSVATLTRGILGELYELGVEEAPLQACLAENPRLVQILCLIYQERIRWLKSRASEKSLDEARKLEDNFGKTRHDQFRALQSAAQSDAAMKLAETYRDMRTLTELVVADSQFAFEIAHKPDTPEQKANALDRLAEMVERIGKYFEKFGDDWGDAFFDEAFSGTRAGRMLDEGQNYWNEALTRYLRANSSRAKICWINDVTAQTDFTHAASMLLDAATEQETNLWSKKVELSMSKLALLAEQEDASRSVGVGATAALAKPERELNIIEVQETLYQFILPEVIHCIDRTAELEVAMQKFGKRSGELKALRGVLSAGMERVLAHVAISVEELIDVLTLMDMTVSPEGDDLDSQLDGEEFFLALRALNAAAVDMSQERFETLLQLIWKRCYIYDDWVTINTMQTSKKHATENIWTALRNTATWRTYHFLHSHSFLSKPECNVRALAPSECFGAGCRLEDLSYRFENPDLLGPILSDNRIQDELLQSYVTDRRLEQWVRDCEEDATNFVAAQADARAETLKMEREFELAEHGEGINGKANGHTNGVRQLAATAERNGGLDKA